MEATLNAEFLRELSYIAEDEGMMKKLARYVHRLFEKRQDDTLFTKEEYFHRLDEAEGKYAQGIYFEMKPNESLEDFLKRTA